MSNKPQNETEGANDPLYAKACALVIEKNRPSVSMVQRRLNIGYQRSQRMLEAMEGTVISPFSAQGVRRVINEETAIIAALEAQVEALTKERDEADRRAGTAERMLSDKRETLYRLNHCRDNQKAAAGFDRNVSFDVVWASVLADAKRLDWLDTKGGGWIARESETGRGYRLHQSPSFGIYENTRDAIDAAREAS